MSVQHDPAPSLQHDRILMRIRRANNARLIRKGGFGASPNWR